MKVVKTKLVAKKEDAPIDENFDYENFPQLPVNQQIESIPPQFLSNIELGPIEMARSHPTCKVKKRPDNHGGGWACDKIKGASYCLSGITGFYQSKGI